MQFDWFKHLFCFSSQQVQFHTTFYASPVVHVSVHHDYDRKVKNHIPPEYNIITAWAEVRHNVLLHAYQRQFRPRYFLRNWRVSAVNIVSKEILEQINNAIERRLIFHFSFRKLVWTPWGFVWRTWVDQEVNTTLCLSALLSLEVCIMSVLSIMVLWLKLNPISTSSAKKKTATQRKSCTNSQWIYILSVCMYNNSRGGLLPEKNW